MQCCGAEPGPFQTQHPERRRGAIVERGRTLPEQRHAVKDYFLDIEYIFLMPVSTVL
jgi:hypothetical protein